MDLKDQVSRWLQNFDPSFRLDEFGRLTLKDSEGQSVTINVTDNYRMIFFCAGIDVLPEENRSECLEWLMRRNFCGLDINFCTLSLEPETQRIVLHYCIEGEFVTENTFPNILNNFISTTKKVGESWTQFLHSSTSPKVVENPVNLMIRI